MPLRQIVLATVLLTSAAWAADPGPWSDPAEVRYEDQICVSYRARLDGPYLVVRATVGPGWHTFVMDNERRAREKLAGKQPLSIDKSTEIVPAGLDLDGPWYQTQPKDFSRPELRWFSWGFDGEATFVAKVARAQGTTAQLTIQGQACTEKICKNVDTSIALPLGSNASAAGPEVNLKDLVAVRK